jgi:hypothetical protein
MRHRRARWTIEVTGWRYTRRWTVGVRRGEWWIGVRHDLPCDCWEINMLGLTILVPDERTPW